MNRVISRCIGLLLVLTFGASANAGATFTPLSVLHSIATGVSADGAVVVGRSDTASSSQAFRWTAAGGMVGLGVLPGGVYSDATGVSADGAVVVGTSEAASGAQAFRWTAAGGMVGLGVLPGGVYSDATGVSADGAVVVGTSEAASSSQAFRWTAAGGMVGLGDLPGEFLYSGATGVSADGAVVVGSNDAPSGSQAFRWTAAGGMVGLVGVLPGGSFATGVSADGAVVVGSNNYGSQAFRWTAAGGMVGLGDLPGGILPSATGVSADGAVVVGDSSYGRGSQAFVWTQANGMQRLLDVLLANGATGLTGWTLSLARAISADGKHIVGAGINPSGQLEAWMASFDGALVQLDQVTVIDKAVTVSVGTSWIAQAPVTVETEVTQGVTVQTQRQTIAVGDSAQQVFTGLQNNVPATVKSYVLDSLGNRALTAAAINATPQAVPDVCKDFTKPLPPILLLHGFNSNKGIWLTTETTLKQCVGPNVESKTLSDGDGPVYEDPFKQVNQLARWINDVKLSTGASRVILVGHSQGGILARLYAQTGSDPFRFCEFYQNGPISGSESLVAANCANSFTAEVPLFSGGRNDVAGIITYGTPHKGLDGVPSLYPYLARDSKFLQTLNNFQTFPIPADVLITNIVGRTGKSATDDCLVDTDSQNIRNVPGYPGAAVVTIRGPVKHATTNPFCLRAIGKTPEAQDFAGIAEALGEQSLKINLHSPADIVVTSPSGRTVSKSQRGIWGATYVEAPDDAGDLKDEVTIPFPELGQYQVQVIPDATASPTTTFSVSTELDGQETILVDNVPIAAATSSPFFVTASVSNLLPIANAGSDLVVRPGSLVKLNGALSKDPDGSPSPLTFSWSTLAPTGTVLAGASSNQPTFTPGSAGRYTFALTVFDGLLTSATDTVMVTAPKLGDIDLDGDVDSIDVALITAARNKPASGPNDLKDLNVDGKIDVLDARKAATLCSRLRCATN